MEVLGVTLGVLGVAACLVLWLFGVMVITRTGRSLMLRFSRRDSLASKLYMGVVMVCVFAIISLGAKSLLGLFGANAGLLGFALGFGALFPLVTAVDAVLEQALREEAARDAKR